MHRNLITLSEACQINPPKFKLDDGDAGVSFIPMVSVSNDGKLMEHEVRKYSSVSSGFTYFSEEDVLVAKITPCFENGKGAFARGLHSGLGVGSTEFHVLRARPGFDPQYIYHLTRTHHFRFLGAENMQGSAGQRRVPTDFLKGFKHAFPSYQEQQKIAATLSTWDRDIELHDKLIALKEKQKQGLMQVLLTGKKRLLDDNGVPFSGEWTIVKISDICSVNPKKEPRPQDGRVSFIPMEFVSECAQVIKTDQRDYNEVAKGFTSFRNLDTIIAKITPCFENGKGAFVDNLTNGIGFGSTEFHVLRPNNAQSAKFIYYMTTSPDFRGKGRQNMQGSSGHRRVTSDYIRALKVRVPTSLSEMKKIGELLSLADDEITSLKRKRDLLNQQKQGLMQQLLG